MVLLIGRLFGRRNSTRAAAIEVGLRARAGVMELGTEYSDLST